MSDENQEVLEEDILEDAVEETEEEPSAIREGLVEAFAEIIAEGNPADFKADGGVKAAVTVWPIHGGLGSQFVEVWAQFMEV